MQRVPSIALGLALLTSVWCAAQPVSPASTPDPVMLLKESYALTAGLTPQTRCGALFSLADAAEPIDPALSKAWANELFTATFDLPPSWNRGAFQKNALALLSSHDPVLAFDRQALMDAPVAIEDVVPEDLRAYLGISLFTAYGGPKPTVARMRAIRERARAIAADGAYPFLGIAPILKSIWGSDPIEALAWWQEAMGYFVRQSRVANANEQFLKFLDSMWESLSTAQRQSALEAARSVLVKGTGYTFAKGAVYRGVLDTNYGSFQLVQRNLVLLARLIPKFREVIPEDLEKMREFAPVFAAAAEHTDFAVREVHEVVTHSGGDSNPLAPAIASSLIDEQRNYEEVKKLAAADPGKALLIAGRMGALQSDAFAMIASVAEQPGSGWSGKLSAGLPEIKEDSKNKILQFWVLLLRARGAIGKGDSSFTSAWNGAFNLGEGLFEEFVQSSAVTDPGDNPYLEPLGKLVRLPMRSEPWTSIERIRRVRNDALKAYLLMDAARGLGRTP